MFYIAAGRELVLAFVSDARRPINNRPQVTNLPHKIAAHYHLLMIAAKARKRSASAGVFAAAASLSRPGAMALS